MKRTVRISESRIGEILGYLGILAIDKEWHCDPKLREQIDYLRIQIGEQPKFMGYVPCVNCEGTGIQRMTNGSDIFAEPCGGCVNK